MYSANLTQTPADPESRSQPESDSRFFEESKKLGQQFSAIAHNHVRLAALETRQAGEGLVKIMMIGFFTTFLLFSAWLSLLGALAIVVIENNIVSHVNAFLLIALLQCVLVLSLIKVIRFQSHLLMFSATVNSLEPQFATQATNKAAEEPKEKSAENYVA